MSNLNNDDLKDRAWDMAEANLPEEATRDEIWELAKEIYQDLIEREPDEEEPESPILVSETEKTCDYSPQEELDRIGNRESYQLYRGF